MKDKISYVFTFEPFGWIFGTGEYYSVLKNKFKNIIIGIQGGETFLKISS